MCVCNLDVCEALKHDVNSCELDVHGSVAGIGLNLGFYIWCLNFEFRTRTKIQVWVCYDHPEDQVCCNQAPAAPQRCFGDTVDQKHLQSCLGFGGANSSGQVLSELHSKSIVVRLFINHELLLHGGINFFKGACRAHVVFRMEISL